MKQSLMKRWAIDTRFQEYRTPKEKVVFICLNPSIADENEDDPTLKRCIDYAKRWSTKNMVG